MSRRGVSESAVISLVPNLCLAHHVDSAVAAIDTVICAVQGADKALRSLTAIQG